MNVSLDLHACLGSRSGVGTYAYELARRLRDDEALRLRGNFFSFRSRHDGEIAALRLPYDARICRSLPYAAFRAAQLLGAAPYDSLFGGADLSLFFNYLIPTGVSGKKMTVIYDMAYLRCPETMNRRNLLLLRTQMDATLERCDHILTISEFSKREITELLGVPAERISVIPCAAPENPREADFSAVSARLGIRGPFLLFVGSIEPRKNLARLLEAFDRFKEETGAAHQLVLAGGPGWRNKAIYETASRMKHGSSVVFTGFIREEEKNALYRNAALLVYPSVYEGFGLPPLEAMRFGCPVVCSDAASLPEVVGSAAVLVDPYSVISIAEGMNRVLSDDTCRSRLIAAGTERAATFSWDASAAALQTTIKKVLNQT